MFYEAISCKNAKERLIGILTHIKNGMATVAWVVMRHHKKDDGTYNPKIRITHNRTSSYVSTPIYTELVKFKRGASTGTVISESIKEELDAIVSEYRRVINANPSAVEFCGTSKDVLELIRRRNASREIDFIQYARSFIESIPNDGTRTIKRTGINSLCHFLAYKGMSGLSIHALTSSFLREYEAWLRTDRVLRFKQRYHPNSEVVEKDVRKKALNDSGIHSYMSIIQSVFNQALLEFNNYETGDIVISNNPFKAYAIPKVLIPRKRAVDVDTIRMICSYSSPKKNIQLTRDLYMLSFLLAGMNLADMFDNRICGNHIEYERKKTRSRRADRAFTSVYIHPLAMEIIEKYRDEAHDGIFAFLKDSSPRKMTKVLWYGLRNICADLGIDYIQFYSARHSFATIARNDCGFGKDDIAMCLNHSSGKSITDVYIKEDYSVIEKVIKGVVRFVFGE